MEEKVFTVYYPDKIKDDDIIRAAITLEYDGDTLYTHNETVWKGLRCIGSIFGYEDTDAEPQYYDMAKIAIQGLASILQNEYGINVAPPENEPKI